jgi:hypothetical protein
MIAVNDEIGFEVVSLSALWHKRLRLGACA